MDALQRRRLLGSLGSLAATSVLAGCIDDAPVTGDGDAGDGDGGDGGTGAGGDRLRGDAVIDYPGMVDGEASVSSDESTIEYADPETTFELRAMASTNSDGGGNGDGRDRLDLHISRDLSGEIATAFVAPMAATDGEFEYHVFANAAFVEFADWNVVVGTRGGRPTSLDGSAFEPLADGVYGLVVDATSADVLLLTVATIEELDDGDGVPSGIAIERDPQPNVGTLAPQISFDFEYDADTERLVVTHEGGDSVEAEQLEFVTEASSSVEQDFEGTVNAGTTATLAVPSSAAVSVIWTSEDGNESAVLAQWEGPDA
jgi:hypothetical protein